eukprot:9226024-Pyramimonas_sp.AAC.1
MNRHAVCFLGVFRLLLFSLLGLARGAIEFDDEYEEEEEDLKPPPSRKQPAASSGALKVTKAAQEEKQTPVSFTLEHALNDDTFTPCGTFTAKTTHNQYMQVSPACIDKCCEGSQALDNLESNWSNRMSVPMATWAVRLTELHLKRDPVSAENECAPFPLGISQYQLSLAHNHVIGQTLLLHGIHEHLITSQ